jgi:hypothetical protein
MSGDEKRILQEEFSRLPQSSRSYKFVTVGLGVLFGLAMLFLVIWQWFLAAVELETPVRNFADYLHKHSITAAAPRDVTGDVGTAAGKVYEMEVAGKPIWLCYFQTDNEKQKEAWAAAKTSGEMKIRGKTLPAKVRENVALVGYDGSDKEQEILRAFADYESK